jgi:hypothetical protein
MPEASSTAVAIAASPAAAPPIAPPLAAVARPTRVGRAGRLLALVVAGGCGVVLLVAAFLDASPAGLGTHEQLNLPACGWIRLMDVPCPTCGMTTSFAHAADGNLVASFLAQPMGFLLALAAAMTALLGAYVAATGSRVTGMLGRLWGRRTGWLLAGAVLAAWAFKVVSYRNLLGEGLG